MSRIRRCKVACDKMYPEYNLGLQLSVCNRVIAEWLVMNVDG